MLSDAKEELRTLRKLNATIDALLADKAQQRLRLVSLSRPLKEPVSGTKNGDFTDAIAPLLDMEKEINRRIDEYAELKQRIIHKISEMPTVNYRTLIYYYYVCGLNLYDTAKKMSYSYDWARRAHSRALLEYEKGNEKEIRLHTNTH